MSCPAHVVYGVDDRKSTVALRVLDPPVDIDEHRRDALEALRADIEALLLEVGSSPMLALILETECPQI